MVGERQMYVRVKEGCKMLDAMKEVMICRGLRINLKKVLYEKVIVTTLLSHMVQSVE